MHFNRLIFDKTYYKDTLNFIYMEINIHNLLFKQHILFVITPGNL